MIVENNIDIAALVETETLDIQGLLNSLKMQSQDWKLLEICPETNIKILTKSNVHLSVHKEDKNFVTYKIYEGEEIFLFHVVHFPSPLHLEECARDMRAINVSQVLRKIEEGIFNKSEYKSIIVGDFNLQPYSHGIASVHGFNATMSIPKAKKLFRKIAGEPKLFYFNPTWKLMGDNKNAQGTYYNNIDQQDKSIFWYTFDELLIRPYFIDRFNWDYFEIVERTKGYEFLRNEVIDKARYSDHLPIKFEII